MKNYFLFAAVWLSQMLFAQNWQVKIHPSVFEQIQARGTTEILVILRDQANLSAADLLPTKAEKGAFVFKTLTDFAAQSQRGIQATLRSQNIDFQSFWINNSLFLEANLGLVQQLAQRDDVARILHNPHAQLDLPNDPLSNLEAVQTTWGIRRIKADSVWLLGHRGQNIVIGGADTGYEWGHPAIRKSYRGFNATNNTVNHNYNWFDAILADTTTAANPCGAPSRQPCDDHSHGTHTMGTMAGGSVGDTLAIGVAPDVRWIGARIWTEAMALWRVILLVFNGLSHRLIRWGAIQIHALRRMSSTIRGTALAAKVATNPILLNSKGL
jgi:serine protease AprX